MNDNDVNKQSEQDPAGSPRRVDRRKFLGQVGIAAAMARALGTPGSASAKPVLPEAGKPAASCALSGGAPPVANVPLGAAGRIAQAVTLRQEAATADGAIPAAVNLSNGDWQTYASQLGTFTKGLVHNQYGAVDPASYASFLNALQTGTFAAFEAIDYGGTQFPAGQIHTLNGPQGGLCYDLEKPDGVQFGQPQVPPAPGIASDQTGTELVELYWGALCRDVSFIDYGTGRGTDYKNYSSMAAAELSGLSCYTGPRDSSGKVTPQLLFRGGFPGETLGPYVSQFMLQPTMFGVQPINQQWIRYKAGLDYMINFNTWLQVQNGWLPPTLNQVERDYYYASNGRSMATFTHVDVLFQAYFTAFLLLISLNAPLNPGNPYSQSMVENGFGTFGGPDFAATIAEVAARALDAVWYQKWWVHLRPRPEAAGGIVYLNKTGGPSDVTMSNVILQSNALRQSNKVYNSWLLPQAFPEGSPVHPAYPTGHGTVGGACITILKFFFDGNFVIPKPVQSNSDGRRLVPYTGSDAGQLTVNGELAKLGHNVTFGHGIHAGIHWRSDSDTSLLLGEQVAICFLQERAKMYNEPFNITITKFDGTTVTFTNP